MHPRHSRWFLFIAWILPSLAAGQIRVDTSYNAKEIVEEVLLGNRVQVSNVRYAGSKLSVAVFSDTSRTPLMQQGIMLSTGKVFDAVGPNRRPNTSWATGTRGDHSLEHIAKGMTYDAAWLEFDFVPSMEMISFNFIFASEEYTEYVNTQFNDVFAFWISGPGYKGVKNLAVIPRNNTPITVNSVNHLYNRRNYIDNNPYDRLGTLQKEKLPSLYPDLLAGYEYDGFTTLLTAEARVKPGERYHIKISIADVSDGRYDSAVFLEAGSFTSLPLDPAARAALVQREYAHVRRKFQPARVGEDPSEAVAAVDSPAVTAPVTSSNSNWPFMVNFDFDSDVLTQAEEKRLDSLWDHFLITAKRPIRVQGHTDNVGGSGYNDALSQRRAAAVAAYLKAKGFPAARLRLESYGFEKPATTNATDSGRAVNRRVEIRWADE